MEFVSKYWMYILIGIVFVVYYIFLMIYLQKRKNQKKQLLNDDPTLVKVFIENGQQGIKSVSLDITKLDGEYIGTSLYNEGLKTLFLAKAGKHVVELSATTTRPGVMYKSVSETFGPINLEIELEMGKEYTLRFNVKEKEFELKEK